MRYGVLGMPTVPFEDGTVLSELPRTTEDRRLSTEDLARGCGERVYEELGFEEAEAHRKGGRMILSTFTVWTGEGEDCKGSFVSSSSGRANTGRTVQSRWRHYSPFHVICREGTCRCLGISKVGTDTSISILA